MSPGLAGPGRYAGAKHASRTPRSTTEIGGTSLGDLNGDGPSDYLLTFEGHAEICYSNGIDGFDCRVIEDDTGNWIPPAYFYGYFNTKNPQSTSSQTFFPVQPPSVIPTVVTPYGSGFSAYSVLSVGHATDHNSTEVIYKLGNGNSNNPGDASVASSGDNIYLYQVCTVRDGMRNCGNTYWSGPQCSSSASTRPRSRQRRFVFTFHWISPMARRYVRRRQGACAPSKSASTCQ